MPGAIGGGGNGGWSGNPGTPLRRSSRLNSQSPQVSRGLPGQLDVESPARPKRASRVPGSIGTPGNASMWGGSLSSARTVHEPASVSSFYLRAQPPRDADPLASSSLLDDDSYNADGLASYGSLLRGAQRPSRTPEASYLRHVPDPADDTNNQDYSEEERFMKHVESEVNDRSKLHTLDGEGTTYDTVHGAAHDTSRVSGELGGAAFRSPGKRAKRVSNEARPSTTTPPPASTAGMHREASDAAQAGRVPVHHPRGSATYVLWIVAVGIALAFFLRTWGTQLARTKSDPLIPSHVLREGQESELHARIGTLEDAVNQAWKKVSGLDSELRASQEKLTQRVRVLEERSVLPATLKHIQSDIHALQTGHSQLTAAWQADRAEAARAAERVAALSRDMSALLPLRQHLSEFVPVRYSERTKRVSIDPAFWHELRKVFAPRGQAPASEGAGEAPASWTRFFEANERAIQDMVDSAVGSQTRSGALLSKDGFLQLLDAELARAKAELSSHFNANMQGVQNDILGKVREQQEMYERSGSWTRGGHMAQQRGDLDKGESGVLSHESTVAVQQLIDAALSRFAADQIGRADYALYSAGGRVIPSLTSPTHEIVLGSSPLQAATSVLASVLPLPFLTNHAKAASAVRGRMPVVALHHDNSVGMCWPFSGSQGQLGIQLVRKIHATAITVDHVASVLALDGSASAPRDVEVWGVLETEAEQQELARWRRRRAQARRSSSSADAELEPTPIPPSPAHVYLGAFTYDASPGSPPTQTFPISSEGAALSLPLRVIQVNVLSNHGLRDFTCLYRVRVHGDPVD